MTNKATKPQRATEILQTGGAAQIAPTLKFGRYGHYDMSQNRGISLREAAALQSFPDNYVFYPTDQVDPIARMIGNAVPPKLAQYFASYLLNSIEH